MTLMERGERLPRESAYTPELGRAVCARVAEGVSLRAMSHEPGLPDRTTVYKWAAAYPDFAQALGEAMRAVRVARRLRERSATAVTRQLQMLNPRGNGGRLTCRYTREIATAICERIAEGESLMAICRDPEGPNIATVYNWLRAFPEFEDQYVEARQRQAETLMDEVREVGLGVTKETAWADRLHFDTLRWLTARLAPKKYCEKVMVVEAMRAPRDGEGGGMTVILKRYSDITPEELARADEGEPKGWSR